MQKIKFLLTLLELNFSQDKTSITFAYNISFLFSKFPQETNNEFQKFKRIYSVLYVLSSFSISIMCYSKTCVNQLVSKRQIIGFQDQLSLNADQGERSAVLLPFIKLPFVNKIFVLSIFEWPFCKGFTVAFSCHTCLQTELYLFFTSYDLPWTQNYCYWIRVLVQLYLNLKM